MSFAAWARARRLLILPALGLAFSAAVAAQTIGWVGQPFPGFCYRPFELVTFGGRPTWSGMTADVHADDRILTVDGQPVSGLHALRRKVLAAPVGTPFTYRLQKDKGPVLTKTIPSQRFGWPDYFSLFGPLLLVGAFYLLMGALAYMARPNDRSARVHLLWSVAIGTDMLAMADTAGAHLLPGLAFPVAYMVAATTIHLAAVFPRPFSWVERHPWLLALNYALFGVVGTAIGAVYGASVWASYSTVDIDMFNVWNRGWVAATALAGLFFIGSMAWKVRRPDDRMTPAQGILVLTSLAAGFLPYIALFMVPYVLRMSVPWRAYSMQAMGLFGLFPLAIAISIVKYGLFGINVIVKRTLAYALSTGTALVAYFLLTAGLNMLLARLGLQQGVWSGAVSTAAIAVTFATLHARIRAGLDRVFDRTPFDFKRVVSTFSAFSRDCLDIPSLGEAFCGALEEALHPAYTAIVLTDTGQGAWAIRRAGSCPEELEEPRAGELRIPLIVGMRMIGFVVLGPKRSDQAYIAEDQELVENLAGALALAISNARLVAEVAGQERLQRELEIAREVQMGLLKPDVTPPVGARFAVRCEPALEVGGDFYDIIQVDEHRWGAIIGDVSGKGVPAALMMAVSLMLFRAVAPGEPSASAALGRLNQLVHANRPSKKMFVTALYMVYDARTGEISLANAGQPQPLLDGAPVAIKGLPLGASARTSYKEASLVLAPGQTLAAYSDGLEDLEDEAGAQYGPERVQAYFQHAAALAPAEVMADLRARLATFAGKAPPADDLTVAILQRGPLELERTVPAAEVPERAG